MPAHRHRLAHVPRAPRLARAVAVSLVVALLMAGCGGKDEDPKAGKKDSAAAAEPSASESAAEEAAPDPGYGVPQVGRCYRLSPSETLAPVTSSRRVSCDKLHTTVIAQIGYVQEGRHQQHPVGEAARDRQADLRAGVPEAGRGDRPRPGDLPAHLDPVHARRAPSWSAVPVGCGATSWPEAASRWWRCRIASRCWARACRSHCACARQRPAPTSPAARPHDFRVEAVYAAPAGAYPDPNRYTAAARTRCKELMGKDGGYWQPPSEAGWKAGDRYIRCLSRTSS